MVGGGAGNFGAQSVNVGIVTIGNFLAVVFVDEVTVNLRVLDRFVGKINNGTHFILFGQNIGVGCVALGIAKDGHPGIRPGALANANHIELRCDILRVIIQADAVQEKRPGAVLGRAVGDQPPVQGFAELDILTAGGNSQRHVADVAPFGIQIVEDAVPLFQTFPIHPLQNFH